MQRVVVTSPCLAKYFACGTFPSQFCGSNSDRTGRRCVGVGFRQPVKMRIVSLSDTSSFLVWVLLSHTGAAYFAAQSTMARAAVRRVVALAPHVDPAKHRVRLLRAVTFPRMSSMCCIYVSCLSNFTSRYFGCRLCGRMFPLTLVFSVLNLSRHVCRKLARVSTSLDKLSSTLFRFLLE